MVNSKDFPAWVMTPEKALVYWSKYCEACREFYLMENTYTEGIKDQYLTQQTLAYAALDAALVKAPADRPVR
jgi:hypothetical protein